MMDHSLIDTILTFWFSSPTSETYGQRQAMWFESSSKIDQKIKMEYEGIYEEAKKGNLDAFQKTPKGILALILLFDQFPRNMFRGSKKAFETDTQARVLAQKAIDLGFDQALPAFMRPFIYLPFEHSENLEDQAYSVSLFDSLGDKTFLDYALMHQDVIKRFGRFPFRNESLQRESTPEEISFMKEPRKF